MKTNLTSENFETLTSYIGNRWQKKGDRLYLADAFMLSAVGLEFNCYKTGNIASATLHGEKISNSKATKIASCLRFSKVYIDLETGELMNAREYADEIAAAVNAALPVVEEKEEEEEEEKEEEKESSRPDVEMIAGLLEEMGSPRVTFKKSCLFGKTYKVAVFIDGDFVREVVAFANGTGLDREELALALASVIDDHDKTADLSDKKTLEVFKHGAYTYQNWVDFASKIDVVPSDEVYTVPAVYCDELEKLDLSAVDASRTHAFSEAAYHLFHAINFLQKLYRSCRKTAGLHVFRRYALSMESLTDSFVVGLCETLDLDLEVAEWDETDGLRELLRLRGWEYTCSGSFDNLTTTLFRPKNFIEPDTGEVWSVYKTLPLDLYTEKEPDNYGFSDVESFYDGTVYDADLPCMEPLHYRCYMVRIGTFNFVAVADKKARLIAVFPARRGKKWLSTSTLFELIEKYLA